MIRTLVRSVLIVTIMFTGCATDSTDTSTSAGGTSVGGEPGSTGTAGGSAEALAGAGPGGSESSAEQSNAGRNDGAGVSISSGGTFMGEGTETSMGGATGEPVSSVQGGDGAGGSAGQTGDGGPSELGAAGNAGGLRLPPANAPFDYQLGGAYEPPSGVQVISRDRGDPPAAGLYNICYVNGFQTQPDEEDFWVAEHADLLLEDAVGDPVVDEDWGEILLDTSSEEKRAELAAIVGQWITGCANDGFDAVEVDNLDSYTRSGGLLSEAENVAFMAELSKIAHDDELAVAQKNSTELLSQAADMGTNFAVAEECNRWGECEEYRSVYGDLVFVIEYRAQDFEQGCNDFPELSIVLRDLDVSTPSSASYVYDGC